MKFLPALLAVLAFSSAAFVRAENYSYKESFSRTGAFAADGRLSLENINGTVEVTTWDKNEIRIDGEKSAKTEEELKLIDLKIDLSDTHAAIKVKLPKRQGGFWGINNIRASVRFKVTVPATAVCEKLETVNAGLTLDGLRGPVNAETVNGGIHATNLGGSAKLETVNGSIRADFAAIAADQKISAETVNGKIVIRVPKNAGLTFHAETVNGGIDCDFPIELVGKKHRHELSGRIGDGRATLNTETVNGSIHLESL